PRVARPAGAADGRPRTPSRTSRRSPADRSCADPVASLLWPVLPLQFLLQLIQKAPIRSLGNDLLRTRIDHPHLFEAEGVEAQGVLGVELAPSTVRERPDRLKGGIIILREVSIHNEPGDPLRFEGAHVRRFQDRSKGALSGPRVFPNKFSIPRQHAAEILRPGAIRRAVNQDVADLPRPKFLRLRGEAQVRIDLPLGKKLNGLG